MTMLAISKEIELFSNPCLGIIGGNWSKAEIIFFGLDTEYACESTGRQGPLDSEEHLRKEVAIGDNFWEIK